MPDSTDIPELTGGASGGMQRVLAELDGRIDRQRKRLERMLVTTPVVWPGKRKDGDGPPPRPAAEVAERALLEDLLEKRDALLSRIAEHEIDDARELAAAAS